MQKDRLNLIQRIGYTTGLLCFVLEIFLLSMEVWRPPPTTPPSWSILPTAYLRFASSNCARMSLSSFCRVSSWQIFPCCCCCCSVVVIVVACGVGIWTLSRILSNSLPSALMWHCSSRLSCSDSLRPSSSSCACNHPSSFLHGSLLTAAHLNFPR